MQPIFVWTNATGWVRRYFVQYHNGNKGIVRFSPRYGTVPGAEDEDAVTVLSCVRTEKEHARRSLLT